MAAAAKKLSQLEAQFEPARVELNAAEIESLLSKWRALNQGEDSALECLVRADMQMHLDLLGRARLPNDVEAGRLLDLVSQNAFSSSTAGSQELELASAPAPCAPWIHQVFAACCIARSRVFFYFLFHLFIFMSHVLFRLIPAFISMLRRSARCWPPR